VSTAGASRLTALDGLRGVAALIVVAYHCLLATGISDDYLRVLAGGVSDSGLVNLLANTPIRYLFMGPEAVVVFFVLSGLVLVRPLLRGRSLDLWNYFPRRVLRLWLPTAAAVVLAVVVILCTPQDPSRLRSSWAQAFSFPALNMGDVMNSFFLITGSPKLNNPLWTLRWELLFSLLLPLAFAAAAMVRGRVALWVLACAVTTGFGSVWGTPALVYGPMFLAGALLAVRRDKVEASRRRIPARRTSPVLWFLAGLALLSVPDMVRLAAPVEVRGFVHPFSQGAVLGGACLLVVALVSAGAPARLFSLRPVRFLGRISFSLYLVHMPLLLGAVHLAPEHPVLALLVAIPVIFLVAWLFCRFVEEPSARLARIAGERVSLRVRELSGQPALGTSR